MFFFTSSLLTPEKVLGFGFFRPHLKCGKKVQAIERKSGVFRLMVELTTSQRSIRFLVFTLNLEESSFTKSFLCHWVKLCYRKRSSIYAVELYACRHT